MKVIRFTLSVLTLVVTFTAAYLIGFMIGNVAAKAIVRMNRA